MGKMIELTASDGFKLGAYRADPAGAPKGAVVVIQEIFGVNNHVKRTADGFAARGYAAIAPALFDRHKPGIELCYDQDAIAQGRDIRTAVDGPGPLKDVQAAIDAAKNAGKIAVVGYCWGGTLAFHAATRLSGLACAVGYYGGGSAATASAKPTGPTTLHFRDKEPSIPINHRPEL